MQNLLLENKRLKQEINLNNDESQAEMDWIKAENARLTVENAKLQGEINTLQEKLMTSMTKSDKNEENRRWLLNSCN